MKQVSGYFQSPVGWLEIVVTENAITKINYISASSRNKDGQTHPYLSKVKKQLDEYFHGQRKKFDLHFKLIGTDLQKKIWKEMTKVPFGRTISYKQLAIKSGRPSAARAAGTTCRLNNIPIIVPCHRIVPSAGGIGQYAGGQKIKKYLLALEKSLI